MTIKAFLEKLLEYLDDDLDVLVRRAVWVERWGRVPCVVFTLRLQSYEV